MGKNKIKAIASGLINESIACNRKTIILRKLLQNNEIVDAFNRRGAGKTLGLLRSMLYRDLALQCFNALVDNDPRVISFFQIHSLLSDPILIDDLRNDFSGLENIPAYGHDTLQDSFCEENLKKFDNQCNALKVYAADFAKNSTKYNQLRELRHKVLAHNELDVANSVAVSQSAANLTYGELWKFVEVLQEVATLLHSICNNAGFDFPGADDINMREAENFVSVFST
jgi:AbiU2